MRELKNSQIYFNNTIYRPGDILIGRAEININSPIEVRGIYIKISGRATVYWTETESGSLNSVGISDSKLVSYSNEEIYFNQKFYVFGNEKGITGNKIELHAGHYIYPFEYLLPNNLPSSYADDVGTIIYSVKASLDRPWKFNKFVDVPFIVEALPNIQDNPELKEPNVLTMEKQFGLIFKSRPLKVVLKALNSLFCPGQIIPLKIEIHNESDTTVNSISIKLRQNLTYHATTRDERRPKTLAKNHITSQIRPNGFLFRDHTLQVPEDVILYDFSNCQIIDIDYFIYVELHTAGLTINLVGTMPMYPSRN